MAATTDRDHGPLCIRSPISKGGPGELRAQFGRRLFDQSRTPLAAPPRRRGLPPWVLGSARVTSVIRTGLNHQRADPLTVERPVPPPGGHFSPMLLQTPPLVSLTRPRDLLTPARYWPGNCAPTSLALRGAWMDPGSPASCDTPRSFEPPETVEPDADGPASGVTRIPQHSTDLVRKPLITPDGPR